MKLLITGASGMLGKKLVELAFKQNFVVFGAYFSNEFQSNQCTPIKLDITNIENVNKVFLNIKPDAVIHTAAFTNVDECETQKEKAFNINVIGTKNISNACKKHNSKLVYVSTDFVFDGTKGNYLESDQTNPLSYYGKTKLLGENEALLLENSASVRISVLYGTGRKNFISWIIESLSQKKPIKIVCDQFCSPTLSTSAGNAILEIIKKNAKGIFHTCGRQRSSRLEIAFATAEVFGFDKTSITSTTSTEFKQIAKRPMDSSLNVEKTEKILEIKLLNTIEGLKQYKKELEELKI